MKLAYRKGFIDGSRGFLELFEGLLAGCARHLESVEFDGLGQGPALADGHNISDLDVSEARRHVNGHVLVSLLETVVFLDVVKVIPPDDDGSVHLHLGDDAGQDTSTNPHVAGEGALLVDIVTFASLRRRLESQPGGPHVTFGCRLLHT